MAVELVARALREDCRITDQTYASSRSRIAETIPLPLNSSMAPEPSGVNTSATINILDALLLASHSSPLAAALAVVCFGATMLLQRYVRGT